MLIISQFVRLQKAVFQIRLFHLDICIYNIPKLPFREIANGFDKLGMEAIMLKTF